MFNFDEQFKAAENLVGGNTQTPAMLRVPVEISFNETFERLAVATWRELDRMCNFEKLVTPFEQDVMVKFFKTIVYLHVNNVNDTLPKAYKRFRFEIKIPVSLAAVLIHIGIVVDRDYALRFIPTIVDMDAKDLLTPDELDDVCQKIYRAGPRGFLFAERLLKPSEAGTLEFMALAAMNDRTEIAGYKPGHPVFGFFRNFFNVKGVEAVLGVAPLRVIYGTQEYFDSLVVNYVNRTTIRAPERA